MLILAFAWLMSASDSVPVTTVFPATCADPLAARPVAHPWERAVDQLACNRGELAAETRRAQQLLVARADSEAPALLPRIRQQLPPATHPGYGVLPQFIKDEPERAVALAESRFALKTLLDQAGVDIRAAVTLSARTTARDSLTPLVAELERLFERLRYFDSSIDYHRFWQKAAAEYSVFFAKRTALVVRLRQLQATEKNSHDTLAAKAMRRDVASAIAPFVATRNLAWKTAADGSRVLPVEVVTDISDSSFLAAFERAVQHTWNDSDAARERKFRIAVQFVQVTPASLYAERVPAFGELIDEANHLARFPKDKLVLTIGAKSTHALKGRYVQMGANALSPRVMAHEFGHLLGFDDAYLRGTEGDSTLAYGYTIVEWTGVQDDLMGAPGYGRVTLEMIDELMAAYNPKWRVK